MRFARSVFPLCAAALLIGFTLLGVVYCQDKPASAPPNSLLERLKGFAYVGVTYDERNTSMALHAMSEEQYAAYVEARAKATEFSREKTERRIVMRAKISEARTRRDSTEEILKLQRELTQQQETIERSNYINFGSDVHRIVSIGSDYLEIEYLHQSDMTEIIPLSEIRRVIFRNDLPVFEVTEEPQAK